MCERDTLPPAAIHILLPFTPKPCPNTRLHVYKMPTRIAPETSHDELATFLKENHTALVDLLPEDTDASDLFRAVQFSKPLAHFFDVDEA